MKFLFHALTLGWVLVVALSSGGAAEPTPLRSSENGRMLVDSSGRPVFLLADTAWSLVLRASREDAAEYLRTRKRQGFNAVTFVLFAPGKNELTHTAANRYADLPFEEVSGRTDVTRPVTSPGAAAVDPQQYDYWDHVDHIVALARQVGLYVIILPTWGTGLSGGYDGKDTQDIVLSTDSARVYGTWLAGRYHGEPHVLWMMGGDRAAVYGDRDYRPVVQAMAGALAAGAPRQLISYHSRKGAPQSAEWFHGESWLAFNSIQEWPDHQLRHVAGDWARTPAKPTWLFEGRYEAYWRGNYKAEDWGEWQVRQQAYQTVFAGAFGHTYGHERVFGFGLDKADWRQSLNAPGARSMTHLAYLLERFTASEALSRTPDQCLVAGDVGKAERVKSNYIAAMRDGGARKVMYYTAAGRPVPAKMEKLSAGTYFAFWFNPRTGKWSHAGTETSAPRAFGRDIAGGPGATPRDFVPPTKGDGADWVLVLSREEKL